MLDIGSISLLGRSFAYRALELLDTIPHPPRTQKFRERSWVEGKAGITSFATRVGLIRIGFAQSPHW